MSEKNNQPSTLVRIFVDGEARDVDSGKNLLESCLSSGDDLPYFCWHPSLGSVGSCRQCAIIQYADEKDERGRLVTACMTAPTEGMRISLNADKANDFRENLIETVMTNHPHDCPVCEEAGECHLQDMVNMSSHQNRDYDGDKRTYQNQYLGPFIGHEMNRCITCYRCTRFYNDYAGGDDLVALRSSSKVYIGRHEEGVLENEFSGNLVEVCPTGVFTDKTYSKHYARKWDLQNAPAICTHCSLGCNISPGERAGTLRRVMNRYHPDINAYFLCDRGRFAYEYVNSDQRLTSASVKSDKFKDIADGDLKGLLGKLKTTSKSDSSFQNTQRVGVGSPRASLESNYALLKLVGQSNFYSGLSVKEHSALKSCYNLIKSNPNIASLKQIENADAVIIIGEDILHTAPRMSLAVRQAIVANKGKTLASEIRIPEWDANAVQTYAGDQKNPFIVLHTHDSKSFDLASDKYFDAPDNIARVACIAAELMNKSGQLIHHSSEREQAFSRKIVDALTEARNPLIICGASLSSDANIEASAQLYNACLSLNDNTSISVVLPEANSMGLACLLFENAEEEQKSDLDSLVKLSGHNHIDQLIVLEHDLTRRLDKLHVERIFSSSVETILLDCYQQGTCEFADCILPAATSAEAEGIYINNEGRAQQNFSCMHENEILPSWQWLQFLSETPYSDIDTLLSDCADDIPVLKALLSSHLEAKFRVKGKKVARQTHRYSGRTSLKADIKVSEEKQQTDNDSAFSFSMEGARNKISASMQPSYWSPSWNSNESLNKFQQEIGGALKNNGSHENLEFKLFASQTQNNSNPIHIDNSTTSIKNSAWIADDKYLLIIPEYQIFSSDELGALSPSLKDRAPKALALISAQDAQKLKIQEKIEIEVAQKKFSFEVAISPGIAKGCIALPLSADSETYFQLLGEMAHVLSEDKEIETGAKN